MARAGRRLTRVGAALALAVVVQLLAGLPAASAAPGATTTTSAPTTSASTTTTSASTATTSGPTTTTFPRECDGVLDENARGGLQKDIVGGDETIGLNIVRIDTPRPPGVYHVVDCWRVVQDAPNPLVFTATDIGDLQVSGTATFHTQIPFAATPGEDTCDQVVMTGRAGGKAFRDVSNVICTIYSSCLYAPECPQNQPPPTSAPASTGTGTLPFTGSNDPRPLLVTAIVLLVVGAASLLAARRRYG